MADQPEALCDRYDAGSITDGQYEWFSDCAISDFSIGNEAEAQVKGLE